MNIHQSKPQNFAKKRIKKMKRLCCLEPVVGLNKIFYEDLLLFNVWEMVEYILKR